MVTLIVLLQLAIVLTMIFIGARIGGIGMGILACALVIFPST